MKRNNKLSTEQLLQFYANAKSTASCGGHWKGERNDCLYESYALQLRERGIYVPKDIPEILNKSFIINVDVPKGIFNGEGSC